MKSNTQGELIRQRYGKDTAKVDS